MASLRVVQRFTFTAMALCVAAAAAAASQDALAQYKWIDPSGRVNYGDRPPAPVEQRRALPAPGAASATAAAAAGDTTLPWALRSATTRYPVVLYTTNECEPCELGRVQLAQRGVPYVEKRIENAADLLAFKALGFDRSLFPSVSIGPEKLTGFEEIAWNRALDATGYPKSSMLPATYVVRTLEPMRAATARNGAAPQEPAGGDAAGETTAQANPGHDPNGLLTPSSFRTGPNPIRF